MRRQDLKVGEEYAAGSSSRFSRYDMARVRVIELDGQRTVPHSWGGTQQKRGIVVALVEDHDGYDFRGKAGDEKVLSTARDIQSPWAPYVERKAAHEKVKAEQAAERRRVNGVANDAQDRLIRLGFKRLGHSDGTFRVPADTMAAILALIPDGHDAP